MGDEAPRSNAVGERIEAPRGVGVGSGLGRELYPQARRSRRRRGVGCGRGLGTGLRPLPRKKSILDLK